MAGSLRDQLAESYDKITAGNAGNAGNAGVETPPEQSVPAEVVETPSAPPSSRISEAPKQSSAPAASDGRARDPETGKFVPKEDAPPKEAIPSAAKVHPAQQPLPGSPQAQAALAQQPQAAPAVPAVSAKPRPQRPSSWKKEYWDHWEKIDPQLAEYLAQRESEYARGVSTYKSEWDKAKPLLDAMAQFQPELEKHHINPTQWITELGHVHRMLALGTPQQKLQTVGNILRAYGIPPQVFSDQQASQQYLQQGQFQQPYAPPVPPQQRPLTAEEANQLFQQKFLEVDSEREIQRFAADTAKHPYFNEVRETMGQLLDAKLAEDLDSAYEAALRHPRHAPLWEAIQQQDRAAQEEQRRAAEAARVNKARGKAVSPASATPSGAAEEKPKGLRSSLESAYDTHMGGGRV